MRAYRKAAQIIKGLHKSIDAMVHAGDDVTRLPGIGKGIANALREIILSGTLGQMQMDLSSPSSVMVAVGDYPALDPKRVARV